MRELLKKEPVFVFMLTHVGVNVGQLLAFNPTWLHIVILIFTSLGAIPVRNRVTPNETQRSTTASN